MYRRILVPLDGSPLAEGVLPHVRTLAKGLKASVSLLHVLNPQAQEALADPAHGHFVDRVEASARAFAMDYLQRIGKALERYATKVDYAVDTGHVPTIISNEAGNDQTTLIAMSTHGRGGLGRWLLGSVAYSVLHTTRSPLLLVRSKEPVVTEGEARLDTVIVPLDGSPASESILPHVVDLAKATEIEVLLVRALIPIVTQYGIPIYESEPEVVAYLREKADQLQEEGVAKVNTGSLLGDAAQQIVVLAQKTPNNLVAMASHARIGVDRWVLGSVTDRVVRHSGDPVLIVRSE